ncbi:MAG TPA: TetR/AcrR family transcriptional regulator [Humibacter sp.]|nr:TetR/AcrR family transcriptional regulator [Humibacter sp.]
MPGNTRARMLDGTIVLLAKRGLQDTSFSTVLEYTGTPRGSIYFHFPGGKDQLVTEAVQLAGERSLALITSFRGKSARGVTSAYLGVWREVLTRSDLSAGCAALAVTVATDSPELLEKTSAVFRAWRTELAAVLKQGGLKRTDAAGFAAVLVAAAEGAVALSRAERSLEPFDTVRRQLLAQATALARTT